MSNNNEVQSPVKARMEIAVYPLGTDNPSISREVSLIFDTLENCGLSYNITVMGTIIEGTPDELFILARKLHDAVFSEKVKRVLTVIKIDDRR
ncbi:MTH1187 family thiamine-binding protein [Candidatus Latescibacterota bacterium]